MRRLLATTAAISLTVALTATAVASLAHGNPSATPGALSATPGAQSTSVISPVVAGYEQLRRSDPADERTMGEVLLGELNCLSCHAVSDPARNSIADRIATKPAPDLSEIGRRVTPEWLATYLADPQAAKPGSTMPNVFHSFAPQERDDAVQKITHFLIRQGGEMESPGHPTFRFQATVERGRGLFHSIGCVACHAPEESSATPATPSVPLPNLAARTSVGALVEFLLDPDRVRPGGRMPSLYLSEDEATDIAVYLLRDQEPEIVEKVAGFEFEYFLDPMQDEDAVSFFTRPPPIYDELTPAGFGRIDLLTLELPIRTRGRNHMFRFSGLIPIEEAGAYTFVLGSDRRSGSELLIDGHTIATKDRDTGRETSAHVELAAGDHDVEVTYYLRGDTRQPYLEVSIEGGTIEEPTPIDRVAMFANVTMAPRTDARFEVNPERAREGRRLFAEMGCASCHALSTAATGAAPLYPAPPLEALDPNSLAAGTTLHAGKGSPRYNLAAHQKQAIRAALSDLDELARPRDAGTRVVHALATYNCYACHQRADDSAGRDRPATVGGPGAVRDPYFKVVGGMDLGDEGRIPPALTGIGGKLKRDALVSVLTEERMHVRRNYMQTRMPRFGDYLIDRLPAALDQADAQPGDLVEPPFSAQAVQDGVTLAGSTGLRCITCHDIGVNEAAGISTINLANAYDRLRPAWVARLLLDPHSINEDTRMPAFWAGGSVIHPDIAGGTAAGQIDAIWSYLSLGASMPEPEGMNLGDSLVLRPGDEPIIFRTFMTDVGPRAIVVGYPESVHLGFDANVMRLAKAWRGGFYDAQGTWSGRAGQFLDPYGDEVINMPPGPALAYLDNIDTPWPPVTRTDRNIGGRFMGYRLDEQRRPIFMYRLGDVVIEEQPIPVLSPGGTHLIRRFSLEAGEVSDALYLLLAEGDEITRNPDGSWTIDGRIGIVLRSSTPMIPIVRTSQGVQQLLLPVGIASNQTVSIDVEISW